MALDVFHQVLARLHEAAGGNPRQMISIVEVLKLEKLFGSVDTILDKLHGEGWIADAPKKDHVFVTTWGIEELRRASGPAAARPAAAADAPKAAEPKNAGALREAAGKASDLAAVLAELATGAGGTGAQRKAKAKKALAALTAAVEEAFE